MAEQLIESLTTDFDPTAYRDEYREQLLALIERKAEGKEIVASEAEAPKATKAPDLMAALEESIAAVKGKGAQAARKPRRRKPQSAGQKGESDESRRKARRAPKPSPRSSPWPTSQPGRGRRA